MKKYRPCSYRVVSEIGETCEIAIQPTSYNITPSVCNDCTVIYPACEFLTLEILLGENQTGAPVALVTKAWCKKKGTPINSYSFSECEKCMEFIRKLPSAPLDPLTKLYRRDYLDNNIQALFNQADDISPLTVIFLDIDHFKMVNDIHGHRTGDIVLEEVSRTIKNEIGTSGACCRYGGEEIVVLLPATDKDKALEKTENIRKRISNLKFPGRDVNQGVLSITISSGISEFPKCSAKSPSDLLEQADKALYRAKEDGRNKVYIYDSYLDSESSLKLIEFDFYGQPPVAQSGKVLINKWFPYPSNPKKLMAVELVDVRTGIVSQPGDVKLEEIKMFFGKPIEEEFEGRIESIKLTEKRSIFLVKVRESIYDRILNSSINFFKLKKEDLDKNIKFLKKSKS